MEPMYCDICGEIFLPYKPKLVVCHLPESKPGSVLQMCPKCEGEVEHILGLDMPKFEEDTDD